MQSVSNVNWHYMCLNCIVFYEYIYVNNMEDISEHIFRHIHTDRDLYSYLTHTHMWVDTLYWYSEAIELY